MTVAIGVTLAITFLFTTKGADGSPVLNFDGLRWLSLFTSKVAVLELPQRLWDLMVVGVGGYIAGRSGEKIARIIKSSS